MGLYLTIESKINHISAKFYLKSNHGDIVEAKKVPEKYKIKILAPNRFNLNKLASNTKNKGNSFSFMAMSVVAYLDGQL